MNNLVKNVVKKSKIYCFGAGAMGKDFVDFLLDCGYDLNNLYFIDNDKNKHGTTREVDKYKIEIQSKEFMLDNITHSDCIVVATLACHEIYKELTQNDELKDVEIYFSQLVFTSMLKPIQKLILQPQAKEPIPKIIHYCWFGGAEIPIKWKRFIEGWQEKCPDYEIRRWDENNYDIKKNLYTKQAYEAQRWGFVSDYARLDIIYKYGGIYLDTDVELLKPLDALLNQKAFFCSGPYLKVNTGCGFGSAPQNALIKEMRDYYNNISFINNIGIINSVPCMEYQHVILQKYGFKLNGKIQLLENAIVLPFDILCAFNHYTDEYMITKNTIAVHHSTRTWHDKQMRERAEQSIKFLNMKIRLLNKN